MLSLVLFLAAAIDDRGIEDLHIAVPVGTGAEVRRRVGTDYVDLCHQRRAADHKQRAGVGGGDVAEVNLSRAEVTETRSMNCLWLL